MKCFKKWLTLLILLLTATGIFADEILVDAATPSGPDLLKKFHMMQTGYTPASDYRQLQGRLEAIDCNTIRIDHIWDLHNIVSGTYPNYSYDWTALDDKIKAILADGCTPYFCVSYTPDVLGETHAPPANLEAWQEINRQLADHCVQQGYDIRYYEVWNEPDLDIFWQGSQQDYLQLYKSTVTGILQGDPQARVGGPGLSGNTANTPWVDALLDYCSQESLPIDFVSFHSFTWDVTVTINTLQTLQTMIDNHPSLAPVELHIGEWNNQLESNDGYWGDCAEGAVWLLDSILKLLPYDNLTLVQRAQYIDIGGGLSIGNLGVLDTGGSPVKAIYNAYKLYAMMPDERVRVTTSGTVDAMASANADTVAVVFWNNSESTLTVNVTLDNLPMQRVNYSKHLIDRHHSSYYDDSATEELETIDSRTVDLSGSYSESMTLAPYGSCLIRLIQTETPTVSYTYEIHKGWNLLSAPFIADDMSIPALFPEAADFAYTWKAPYRPLTSVQPGEGFWLYSSTDHTTENSGTPIDELTLDLDRGWNLIGPVSATVDITDPQDTPDQSVEAQVYEYSAQASAYVAGQQLIPPNGYWIYSTATCELMLSELSGTPQTTVATPASDPPPPPQVSRINNRQSKSDASVTVHPAHPNPFNHQTLIHLTLNRPQELKVTVYTLTGVPVRTLWDSRHDKGSLRLHWDGIDRQGHSVSSGVYFICVQTETDGQRLIKVTLVK